MAKTLGNAGGFSADEAVRNAKRSIAIPLLLMFVLDLSVAFTFHVSGNRIIASFLLAILGGVVLFRKSHGRFPTKARGYKAPLLPILQLPNSS